MNHVGDKNNFFKNPIGVIGIFLVLTEAIASLVIVNSKLTDIQNTILVLFVVLFPCAILLAFYLLVTRHHSKLYSPSDYRDEQNFVNTYNSVTQREEIRKAGSLSGEIREQSAAMEKNIKLLKDALADVIEVQKKIVPSLDNASFTEEEKLGFVDNLEDTLSWIDADQTVFYQVEVSTMRGCSQFVSTLQKEGYIAKVYQDYDPEPSAEEEHQAIWLGDEISPAMAAKVVRTAKSFFPHLKYIHLNDALDGAPEYVKYQIFIGGATSTAKHRGLKELSEKDFHKLYAIQDQHELHSFISSFEP